MFSNKDIINYYRQTFNHYKRWWKLDEAKALHYGVWYPETKNFAEALRNTNALIAKAAGISQSDYVLDAGCGVGGTAFYLAEHFGCQVLGINLMPEQINMAQAALQDFDKKHLLKFELQDYRATTLPPASFDVVIACESSCHANPKEAFILEMQRLLKPNGKLVVLDYLLTKQADKHEYLKNWGETWAISAFNSPSNFVAVLKQNKFKILQNTDLTEEILPSAKLMYRAYLLGLVPSVLYNLFFKSSRFAKTHYLSGRYQYHALRAGLWEYRLIIAEKQAWGLYIIRKQMIAYWAYKDFWNHKDTQGGTKTQLLC